jgi:uncharacterized protein (TIGR02145 family)
LWASVLTDLTISINKMKKIRVLIVLSFLITLQSFAQSGVDSTQFYITTTIKGIGENLLKMVASNNLGTIKVSKEYPLIANLSKSDDINAEQIESYVDLGQFDGAQIKAYPQTSAALVKEFKITMGNLPGSKDDVQWVSMSSIVGYIVSGEVNMTGNFTINNVPVFFIETRIIYEDLDSLIKVSDGAICYYDDIEFKYLNGSWIAQNSIIRIPVLDISDITEFTDSTANVEGSVLRDRGTAVIERGTCWSTHENPTLDDYKTVDGMGRGSYKSTLTELTPNTTYYIRAYAINGDGTGFSKPKRITTSGSPDGGTFNYRGKVYHFMPIGHQTWMTDNMAFVPDGDLENRYYSFEEPIYQVPDYSGRDAAKFQSTAYYKTYGALYNWPAAIKVCPQGWHLPSGEDWIVLEQHLGKIESGSDSRITKSAIEAANKLIKPGSGYWVNQDNVFTNSTGFNALPGGFIMNTGSSEGLGTSAYFWSSSESDNDQAGVQVLSPRHDGNRDNIYFRSSYGSKSNYYSVRCLKND